MVMTVYWVWIIANPFLFDRAIVGAPIFNTALYVYGGNIAIFAWVARWLFEKEPAQSSGFYMAILLCLLALIDGFIGVTALNRHLFQGEIISFGRNMPMSDAEMYGYSLAWLIYGGLLLAASLWTRRAPLRHASAGVTLIAILKVFLVDASDLTGLYRVASFLGLGIILVGFGYLYQRFVLKRPG
jgi:uncharacterized membrane protein